MFVEASYTYPWRPFSNCPIHRCFTNHMVAVANAACLNWPSIRDVEKTVPASHPYPQRPERLQTAVAQLPGQNAGTLAVYSCPQPSLVFSTQQRFAVHPVGLTLESPLLGEHREGSYRLV